jgi:hypothetical protein
MIKLYVSLFVSLTFNKISQLEDFKIYTMPLQFPNTEEKIIKSNCILISSYNQIYEFSLIQIL